MAQQCEGTRKDGSRCTKWVMGAEAWEKHKPRIVADEKMKGRLCWGCAVGGWERFSIQTGAYSPHRKKKYTRLGDLPAYDEILATIAPALVATIEEAGIARGTPDWSARLAACALLIEMQPEYVRQTPEQVRELLERILPEYVAHARLTPERAYVALARERHMLRERGHPLSQFESDESGEPIPRLTRSPVARRAENSS